MAYIQYLRARYGTRITSSEGATAVEYGLMVALIAVVIIGAVIVLGENLRDTFSEVATEIGGATSD